MARMKNRVVVKSQELEQAEQAGRDMLNAFYKSEYGMQAHLSRVTGMAPPNLSKLASGRLPISLDSAIKLEIGTLGKLKAEVLCPSGADLLARLFLVRAVNAEQA